MLDVGDTLLVDKLKAGVGYGVSVPLLASSFCNSDLSYDCALVWYRSWTELWKPGLVDVDSWYLR